MIRGAHTMFYTSQPEELRLFLRDKLGLNATDIGGGWMIFDLAEAEVGCHPVVEGRAGEAGAHSISFYCDDIEQTVAELKERGVELTHDIVDKSYGRTTMIAMPGGVEVELYQPLYTLNRKN